MPKMGEVYYLAPQEGMAISAEKGDRPYVVLSTGANSDEVISLAYCSTRPTEVGFGAAHLLVDPATTPDRSCGFSRPTYIYPSRLGSYLPEDLGQLAGRLVAEFPALRRELRFALGLGTGTCAQIDVPRGSQRGRVVALQPAFAEITGAEKAIIVTEHGYSRYRRQQTIVPLLAADEYERGDLDVLVRDASLLQAAGFARDAVLAATPLVSTVFEAEWIEYHTEGIADSNTMDALDYALVRHFGLPSTR